MVRKEVNHVFLISESWLVGHRVASVSWWPTPRVVIWVTTRQFMTSLVLGIRFRNYSKWIIILLKITTEEEIYRKNIYTLYRCQFIFSFRLNIFNFIFPWCIWIIFNQLWYGWSSFLVIHDKSFVTHNSILIRVHVFINRIILNMLSNT